MAAWTAHPGVARALLAVVAVHVAVDALAPYSGGTPLGAQVAGAAVPLAGAAVLAAVWPRMRAGARGAATLCAGVLALVAAASTALRHLASGAVALSDVAGVAAALAGAALVALGAATLWRTRRRDGRPALRRAALAFGALAFAVYVLVPAGVAIVVTQRAPAPVAAADLGRPHERVTLRTADGLRLAGWYVPSRTGAAVLVFPGRTQTVPYARMLVRRGYGVLVVDPRGHGASEGAPNALGWDGEVDVRAAVAFLRGRPDVDAHRIGGLGLSVGGELLLQAAARDAGLRAVVSDGAGARSLAEHAHGAGGAARWITPWIAETAAVAALAARTPPPDLADLVGRIAPRPVLLVQAEHGQGGEELNAVYRRAGGPTTTLWRVRGAAHVGGLRARPREYERRVVGFLDAALRR